MRGAGAKRAVPARSPWIDRPTLGTLLAQTREPNRDSVSAEGGGTETPTLGGAFWFSREHGPVAGEVAR